MVVSVAGLWLSLLLNSTDGETVAELWLSLYLNSADGATVSGLWLSLLLNSTDGEIVAELLDCGFLCCSIVVVSVSQLD